MLEKILMVDDQRQWWDILCNKIGPGYDFEFVQDAMTIKTALKTGNFDLVITNWNFTENSADLLDNFGLNIVQHLRDNYPKLPCIVVTASKDYLWIRKKLGLQIPVFRKNSADDLAEMADIIGKILSQNTPPLFISLTREYQLNTYKVRCLLKHPLVVDAIEKIQVEDAQLNEFDAFEKALLTPNFRENINQAIIEARKIEQVLDSNTRIFLENKAREVERTLLELELQPVVLTLPEQQSILSNREMLWRIDARLGKFGVVSSVQEVTTQSDDSDDCIQQGLKHALTTAKRALAILEQQAAGFSSLSLPAHMQIELEDKRKEVAELESKLSSTT